MNAEQRLRREITMFAAYANTLTPHKLKDPLDPIVSGAIDDCVERILQLITEAKISELQLLTSEVGPALGDETWEDWSWRVVEYLKKREFELKGESHVV